MMTHAKKKRNWKEIGFLISVGIVPLINFLVFYVYMNLDSFLLAFRTTNGDSVSWGFENFKMIFIHYIKFLVSVQKTTIQ